MLIEGPNWHQGLRRPLVEAGPCASGALAARRSAEREAYSTLQITLRSTRRLSRGHNGSGAPERVGHCGGVFDALAIAARRDADLLECREAIESHERRLVAFRGAAAWIHRGREMAHGVP